MLAPLDLTARFALDGAAWQPHGAARCRQLFVHAFRLLPPGVYWLTVAVRYRDGSKRLVPHGERPVSAPLERDDMLRSKGRRGRHAPVLHGLARLVNADATQLEVRVRASRERAHEPTELGSEGSDGTSEASVDLSSGTSSLGVEIDQTLGGSARPRKKRGAPHGAPALSTRDRGP